MSLYDRIAENYDRIVGSEDRLPRAESFCRWLVGLVAPAQHAPTESRPPVVAEAACGTGLYARVLGRLGAKVRAADLSEAMLTQARELTTPEDGQISYVRASMQELGQVISGPVDAALCVGNSLPHLLDEQALDQALASFASLLRPGGVVALQLLNYHRVLSRRERIVGVGRLDNVEFIRFYDFVSDSEIRFNVLSLRWNDGACETDIHETTLRPWRHDELVAALTRAGFGSPALYGGLDRGPFDPQQSDGLVILAHHP